MSAVAAVAPLDVARARRLTKQLQDALDLAVELLGQVFDGQAWTALGYSSWAAYCAAELPQLAILGKGMPVGERRAAVAELRGRGMSQRAIATPLGLSVGLVNSDLKAVDVQLATVTSLDGRQRPGAAAEAAPAPRVTNTDRCVALVAAAGAAGLTWRELGKRAKWHHGQASGALSTVHRQGRLVRTTTYRDGCAVYVDASPAG